MSRAAALAATPRMASALVKRQLGERLAVLRARIETDPGCGQASRLRHAEQALLHARVEAAGALAQDIESALDHRAETAATEAGLAEQARLAEGRGTPTARTAKGPPTRDGFLWLARKGRLTPHRFEAGGRFGRLYARARSDGIRSALANDGPGPTGEVDSPLAARARAAAALAAVNHHIVRAVGGEAGAGLFALLEAVPGRGETLREAAGGEDRKAAALEVQLMTALDMAAVQFGMVRR